MTATHTYPPAVLPAVGSLPTCGCATPAWLDPSDTLAGCGNCGRAMDPRLCCPGPPASPHRLVDGWRAIAYGSAEYQGVCAALEQAEADHEAAPTAATLRAAADAAHSFRVAQAQAFDRARLAEMTA